MKQWTRQDAALFEIEKRCKICAVAKPLDAFSPDDKSRDGRDRRCKVCNAKRVREARIADPTKRLAQAAYTRARQGLHRKRIIALKLTLACIDCGWRPTNEDETQLLEFDHIDPATKHKTKHSTSAFGYAWSWDRIQQEIALCEPRCTPCHRLRTIQQRRDGII